MAIQIGQAAPEFKLFNTEKKEISLSDFKGKNLVILFFIKQSKLKKMNKKMRKSNKKLKINKKIYFNVSIFKEIIIFTTLAYLI